MTMKILRSIKTMQRQAGKLARANQKIGLVPTMGFLHDGHLSLIAKARKSSDFVITTIFVNPTQFAVGEDLEKYPRDEKGDLDKIRAAGGDLVFIPRVEDIYTTDFQTFVNVENLTRKLEGRFRPDHFRGVTTIVAKLFNIIRPDIAVFGQKDYQQAIVIKRMVRDLDYPIKIIVAPTAREKDGLAMSSRNKYFSAEHRQEAACLYQALKEARRLARAEKIVETARLRAAMKKVIRRICAAAKIDYIAFTNYDSLEEVTAVDADTICSLAARIHGVRLIDNMRLL
jgi:pantoate--beta-alanine ligase